MKQPRINSVLVLGATSAIAQECIRRFAAEGARLYLVGRDAQKLQSVSADALVRGAVSVESRVLDLDYPECHEALISDAMNTSGSGLDAVLIAHGVLPDQRKCETDINALLKAHNTNFASVISLSSLVAAHFEARKRGILAVITSVAGDRGRASNYAYGASKAGVTCFLQGLRGRFAGTGVAVITIKPGLVDTPMTAALPKNALYASPARVGGRIYEAILAEKSAEIYVPWFWRWIMLGIRLLPESIFVKIKN